MKSLDIYVKLLQNKTFVLFNTDYSQLSMAIIKFLKLINRVKMCIILLWSFIYKHSRKKLIIKIQKVKYLLHHTVFNLNFYNHLTFFSQIRFSFSS